MSKWLLTLLIPVSITLSQTTIFTLCEGNFGQANSTIWSFDDSFANIEGPIYENLTGYPLGDIGQSMTVYNNKLYIIINNSHTVEVLNIKNAIEYETTIDVLGTSPREMEIVNDLGYLTCWNLNGILVIDILTNSIIDTIFVNGLPEDIIHYNNKLYTSLNMNPDWSSANKILEINLSGSEPVISDTFQVIKGPGQLLVSDNFLYVASTYYDNSWNTYSGTSKIDLNTGEVTIKDYGMTTSYGADLTEFRGTVYRTYNTGIAPITDSLTVDESGQIGNLNGIYSMASYGDYIYFGLSDYVAPDNVVILDTSGQQVANYQVGAIPGSFAFHTKDNVSIDNLSSVPTTFSLLNNYPNPFNPVTVIEFNLPEKSDVTFTIYDLMGREVALLLNKRLIKGNHLIKWDASHLSTGQYIGVLTYNEKRISKKMMLLK